MLLPQKPPSMKENKDYNGNIYKLFATNKVAKVF
jgi:hypothetical protein